MAKILIHEKIPIANAIKAIELDVTTPFAEAIMARLWVEINPDDLKEQPFEDSLRFIVQSGQAIEVRHLFLTWMLNTYIEQIKSLQDINVGMPHRQLLKTGLKVFGSPNRSAWQNCNDRVMSWAKHLHHDLMLKNHLDALHGWGRSDFWRAFIRHIHAIEFHSPNNIILIDFGHIVAIENLNKPAQCALFLKREFWQTWQKRKWDGRPFRLPEPLFKMARASNWQAEMQKTLHVDHGMRMEGWK